MTVACDNYQLLILVLVFDGYFHPCMELKSLWFDSRKISFVFLLQQHLTYLIGDMAMLDL